MTKRRIIQQDIRQIKPKRDYLFVISIFTLIAILLVSIYYAISRLPAEYSEAEKQFVPMEGAKVITMNLPAVSSQGEGVTTSLVVEAMPGSGRVLLDINDLLFWSDTEHSMRIARLVAGNITGVDVNKVDIIYSINANASVIGGESAGAALTIATIAALQNKTINDKIMITGTINHDGSIGPIAGVLAKAEASKQIGATTLLVPLLQSKDVSYETKEHCEKFGLTEVCTVEQIPTKIKVGDEVGISIEEVGSIQEAMKYFFE